jgi:hypothetical protein
MKLWQSSLAGMVYGLLAAPIIGALVGCFYGVPFPCEPNWFSGVGGLIAGAVMYGIILFIPTALAGGC